MLFYFRVLAAEWLFLAILFSAFALSQRLLPNGGILLRCVSGTVVTLWLLAAYFHVLAAFGLYNLWAALTLSTVIALLIYRFADKGLLFREMRSHKRAILQFLRGFGRRPLHVFYALFFLIVFWQLVRGHVFFMLGWDTLTYHGVKAAGWVNTAGRFQMHGPGGWSLFSLHPGTWEVWLSWLMLPFHSDLIATSGDVRFWLLLYPAIMFLAKELGVKEPFRSVAAIFALSVPPFLYLLGSGYTEPALCLALTLATAFALRFLRRGDAGSFILACAAAGLAAGTKYWAQPLALVVLIVVLAKVLLTKRPRLSVSWLSLGIISSALVVLPWIYHTWRMTGVPLAPAEIRLGSLVLGRSIPSVDWLVQQPVTPYRWSEELRYLKESLPWPGVRSSTLGWVTVIPWLVAIVALIRTLRRKPLPALLMLSLTATALIVFYSPRLSMIRLIWGNQRFLLVLVCLLTPASFVGLRAQSAGVRLYGVLLGLLASFNLVNLFGLEWSSYDGQGVIVGTLLILSAIVVLRILRQRIPTWVPWVAALVLIPGLLGILKRYRHSHRYDVLSTQIAFHDVPRFWVEPARILDRQGQAYRIAVTSGPLQRVDSWFSYYLMGRKLQNQVTYVPITRSGAVVDFWPPDALHRQASFQHWRKRLYAQRVTHVMSFYPVSLEQIWMERNPQLFQRMAGDASSWGLYRVKRSAGKF